jgi:flagellar motor protein MotB
MRRNLALMLGACGVAVAAGCRGGGTGPLSVWQNPNYSAAADSGSSADITALSGQLSEMNQRLSQFDADNHDLHGEIASLQQKLQATNDYNFQLRQQLADAAAQLQQVQAAREQLAGQLAQSQSAGGSSGATMSLASGATIRANNSLMDRLPRVEMPGVTARMDGDVIRVELASDSLFVPGTYQLQGAHTQVLTNLASAIRQHFPQQIVGIEAHWDGTPVQPATMSHHQITATQALAVFDYLQRAGLPPQQMFTMSMGSNRPRYSPATGGAPQSINANRRIEIVIYPETYSGA